VTYGERGAKGYVAKHVLYVKFIFATISLKQRACLHLTRASGHGEQNGGE